MRMLGTSLSACGVFRLTMRMFMMALLLLGACAIAPVMASPDSRATPEHIAQLIALLGSTEFKARQAATAELDSIGEPALLLLQAAIKNRDPEISRRAELLARSVQKRIET